jgi:hypothetical protein
MAGLRNTSTTRQASRRVNVNAEAIGLTAIAFTLRLVINYS